VWQYSTAADTVTGGYRDTTVPGNVRGWQPTEGDW
jgi:hypothetical protein